MKLVSVIFGVLGGAAMVGVWSAGASAGTISGAYGTLTASDVSAVKGNCVTEVQRLSVVRPAVSGNEVLTITGPGGVPEYGSFDGAGNGEVQLCAGVDPAGTYTERVDLYDSSYQYVGALSTSFRFSVDVPSLKASVKHATIHGQRGWQMTAIATLHGDPWQHRTVHIQALISGYWFDLPGQDLRKPTNSHGRAVYNALDRENHYAFRFQIRSTPRSPQVTSSTFRLPYYR